MSASAPSLDVESTPAIHRWRSAVKVMQGVTKFKQRPTPKKSARPSVRSGRRQSAAGVEAIAEQRRRQRQQSIRRRAAKQLRDKRTTDETSNDVGGDNGVVATASAPTPRRKRTPSRAAPSSSDEDSRRGSLQAIFKTIAKLRSRHASKSSEPSEPDVIDPVYLAIKQGTQLYPTGKPRRSEDRDLSPSSSHTSSTDKLRKVSDDASARRYRPRVDSPLAIGGSGGSVDNVDDGAVAAMARGELPPRFAKRDKRRPRLNDSMKSMSLDANEVAVAPPRPLSKNLGRQITPTNGHGATTTSANGHGAMTSSSANGQTGKRSTAHRQSLLLPRHLLKDSSLEASTDDTESCSPCPSSHGASTNSLLAVESASTTATTIVADAPTAPPPPPYYVCATGSSILNVGDRLRAHSDDHHSPTLECQRHGDKASVECARSALMHVDVGEAVMRLVNTINLSDGCNVLRLTRAQVVVATLANTNDGYILIRTHDKTVAMCPLQYLASA